MEQSPGEPNKFSVSQEILRILRSLKVHYRIHKSPPPASILSQTDETHSAFYCLVCIEGSVRVWDFCGSFMTSWTFYGEELLALCPTPKLEDNRLSALRNSLFSIFSSALHIWIPFLHPQPEDAPCCVDRDQLITVTGTNLSLWQGPTSLWQGPTYHCDRNPHHRHRDPHHRHRGLHHRDRDPHHCDRDPLITETFCIFSINFKAIKLHQTVLPPLSGYSIFCIQESKLRIWSQVLQS